MELTAEVKQYITRSVLCWLATVSDLNEPNVSPKEIFDFYASDKIIVANIASPQTIKNIKQNANVCISFIDILIQKGFQVKGTAEILNKSHSGFSEMEKVLLKLTGGDFPFSTITVITAKQIKPILAPRYMLYPETTQEEQIEAAKRIYGF